MLHSPNPNINTHINTHTPQDSPNWGSSETSPPLSPDEPRYEIVHVFDDHETLFGKYETWSEAKDRFFQLAKERGKMLDVEQSGTLDCLSFHDGHDFVLRPIQ